MNKIPLLTFDKLFDLIEGNQFENETDKKIAEKILEAERDWRISLEFLNDFITVLEKEVGGTVTKTSLDKLLKKYNQNIAQYAWESESVSYLLDIFDLTKKTELRIIFNELAEKLNKKMNSTEKLYDYLNKKLPSSVNYEDLHNLYYSLFCTLDILPENLKSLKLTKEVLALTFVKLSSIKKITKLVSNNNITDENYWIEQIAISMTEDKQPNHENARILIGIK